jgi:hypothetical protein
VNVEENRIAETRALINVDRLIIDSLARLRDSLRFRSYCLPGHDNKKKKTLSTTNSTLHKGTRADLVLLTGCLAYVAVSYAQRNRLRAAILDYQTTGRPGVQPLSTVDSRAAVAVYSTGGITGSSHPPTALIDTS